MTRVARLPLPERIRRRAERQYLIARAYNRRRALKSMVDRTAQIRRGDILAFVTLRNERIRLPYFLEYYRAMGVNHFLFVNNDSTDGSGNYLAEQPDVSLWWTDAGYKKSRFGMDWMNRLLARYGHGHWCLTVDPDEFLVYPHCDTRPLSALTGWLEASDRRSFPAMLLDMYPKGAIEDQPYAEGQDPFEIARWFDPVNYSISKNWFYGNLWIQGGPRTRNFFRADPLSGPALNKIPLIKWHWRYAYVSSTHMALPRHLNHVYDEDGGEQASGSLLHAKFLSTFAEKSAEELDRRQHYANSKEYRAYHAGLTRGTDLWCSESREYVDWQQLEDIGLISRGNWA
ncbi:glycosyltransferase family 2 protein [Paracoccus sp. 1_MG-2023]|uniref:glycosyltransferase family 2 protein n=1 Tax=unclassified Paracoccus (in: a-proteobacteria) TaxID=2688777 RepID=UPI001C095F22|nr:MULTISPECIES: glycosyltransferase family 2 protein [unclassified Paracoccus (in: a-proteobacteria)]MBU2957309.1 glycosyltransferase family 2 protein [Paracoccus sp. C2R09]MDO6669923.1 glycosyltransferase family 2 protein [Paracoccus sp. 1_MG-2023]